MATVSWDRMTGMDIAITRDEVLSIVRPMAIREFKASDPEWLALVAKQAEDWQARAKKRKRWGWIPGFRRGQKDVRTLYSRGWGGWTPDDLRPGRKTSLLVWGDWAAVADAYATKRIHLLYLMRVIEALKPSRVLEVGCGVGVNLFVLAAQFPDIKFEGIELTAEGVATAKRVCSEAALPKAIGAFSPLPVRDQTAHKRITFTEANATKLPFPDGSFDLVFSVLALEQMEAVRDPAMREMTRVSNRWLTMVEPFRDVNQTPLRANRHSSLDYFNASFVDLETYGLAPAFVATDIPCKLTLGVAVVVTEKRAD